MKKIILLLLIFLNLWLSVYASDYIIYTNWNDSNKLYRKNIDDSSNGTGITSNEAFYPSYSPDGNYIIYSNWSDAPIYRKNANDNSNGTAINSVVSYNAVYSPDWQYIIYANNNDWDKLYRKNANDTWNWTAINSVSTYAPVYSPDWNYIIYTNQNDWWKLYRKNANDTWNGTAINTVESWWWKYSPNWQYIVYSNWADWYKLYRKNAGDTWNGTAINNVMSDSPVYSSDGNYIIYTNYDDWYKLYRKNANDSSNGVAITSVESYYVASSRYSSFIQIPTNLKQFVKLPEAPTLEPQEIPLATKVWKFQSGTWIILSANISNTWSSQVRLAVDVYRLWQTTPTQRYYSSYFSSWTWEVIVPYSWLWDGKYFWKARTEVNGGWYSDWVNYENGYAWEYDFTYFSGFEPYPYGYKFWNNYVESWTLSGSVISYFDTNFPFYHREIVNGNKWNLFDNTFNTTSFTNNERKKMDIFEALWLDKEDSLSNWSCHWMAVSAAMQYSHSWFLNNYFSWFYNQIWSWDIWHNINAPKTSWSAKWNNYNNTLSTILSFQLSQNSVNSRSVKANWITDLDDIIYELQNNPNKTYILSFFGTKMVEDTNWNNVEESVWHSVVPYKVQWNKIYFWDNNVPYPYTDMWLANNQYVTYFNDWTWEVNWYKYDIIRNSWWTSFTKAVLVNIDDLYNWWQKSPPIWFNDNDWLFSLSWSADVIVKDSLWRISWFSNWEILEWIPWVDVITPLNETLENDVTQRSFKQIYLPQKQNLEISIIWKNSESYDAMIAWWDYYTKIESVETSSWEIDKFISSRENLKIDFDNSKDWSYNLLVDNFYNNWTWTVYMYGMPSIAEKQNYDIDWSKVINDDNDSVIYSIDLDNDWDYENDQNLPPIYQYIIPAMMRTSQPTQLEEEK